MATKRTKKSVTKKQAAKHAPSAAMKFLDSLIGEPIMFGVSCAQSVRPTSTTLATIAHKLGCSPQYVIDVELGRRNVLVATAARWATLLGYAPAYWVRVAMQSELDANHLPYRVRIEAA
jgi:transcriptional regulator with XRE-family HTH domain